MVQTEFTDEELEMICQTLDDTPYTVIPIHHIRERSATLRLVGTANQIDGLALQYHSLPEELDVFGNHVNAIKQCLDQLVDWTCVNVASDKADGLAKLLQMTLDSPIRHYPDVHYVLEQVIIPSIVNRDGIEMRFLSKNDIELDNVPKALIHSTLHDYVAGAIVDECVISVAHVSAISKRYADVGVYTNEEWRGQGISTVLSKLVMHRLQEHGYTPVWSTGHDNIASRRVAEKVGMTFLGSRMYLIVK